MSDSEFLDRCVAATYYAAISGPPINHHRLIVEVLYYEADRRAIRSLDIQPTAAETTCIDAVCGRRLAALNASHRS